MSVDESVLKKCLFFTSNRLSNVLRRMANDVYRTTGIATPYIYLLIVVDRRQGITMTELSERLDIAPSTCTRFVEALERQKILYKEAKWKNVHVFLTDKGKEKLGQIETAMTEFAAKCVSILGAETSDRLAGEMTSAADRLEQLR